MIRLIISVPNTQIENISTIFSQYLLPMPGTIEYNENFVLDAIVNNDFSIQEKLQNIPQAVILGQWSWNGVSDELNTIIGLDSSFINYLPQDSILQIPNNWAGWPVLGE